MYRVLFAEDELLVRLGLENSINWETFGMELVAEADNGARAYELFLKWRPDLVITDIKMGGMDGYQLIQKIRKMDPDCAIIIISCLDDFATLRKMMGYCIIGYVLKASMTMEEIEQVLANAKEYLDRRQNRKEEALKEEKQEKCCQKVKNYLCSCKKPDTPDAAFHWKADFGFPLEEVNALLLFQLKNKDQGKINQLGMKLVHRLIQQSIEGSYLVEVGPWEICALARQGADGLKEGLRRFSLAVEQFLGVGFWVKVRQWDSGKSLWENYQLLLEEKWGCAGGECMDPGVEKACAYMQENYKKQLTLSGISGHVSMSPGYFSTFFKKQTGKNVVEYLNHIRLEKVMQDLEFTKDKIWVIASRHGFRNLEYFNRFFKKKTGTTPVKWRQDHGKRDGEE